jgi:hypothetical protein
MEKRVFHLEVRISAQFTEVADNLDILRFLKFKIHSVSKNWSLSIFRNTGRRETPLWWVLQRKLLYITRSGPVISYSPFHLMTETDENSEKLCFFFQTDIV